MFKNKYIRISFIVAFTSSCLLFAYLLYIDSLYSRLINNELASFQTIQKLTKESNKNYILLLELINPPFPCNSDSLYQEWWKVATSNNHLMDSIKNSLNNNKEADQAFNDLFTSRKVYHNTVVKIIPPSFCKRNDSCRIAFAKQVKPSFFSYQAALENYTKLRKDILLQKNNELSRSVFKSGAFFFSFSLSMVLLPVLVIFLMLFIVGILAIRYYDER
jgi:hypothetical protein